MQFFLKTVVSAVLIAAAAELGKRSTTAGAVLASLPLTSILAMSWLFADTRDAGKVAALSTGIFWAVAASLPMFLVLAWLLRRGVGYLPALGISCVVAALGYGAYAIVAP